MVYNSNTRWIYHGSICSWCNYSQANINKIDSWMASIRPTKHKSITYRRWMTTMSTHVNPHVYCNPICCGPTLYVPNTLDGQIISQPHFWLVESIFAGYHSITTCCCWKPSRPSKSPFVVLQSHEVPILLDEIPLHQNSAWVNVIKSSSCVGQTP